jgi:hypothetical protein
MDHSTSIAQFNSVTGNADQALASQFLEAAGWDVAVRFCHY